VDFKVICKRGKGNQEKSLAIDVAVREGDASEGRRKL
jgi:hypothetical protein